MGGIPMPPSTHPKGLECAPPTGIIWVLCLNQPQNSPKMGIFVFSLKRG